MSIENSIGDPDGLSCSKTQLLGVSCSVCLEAVTDAGERSIAKLKCGHHFHLDCIGSAFNAKGRMQCPNCRQVEHGEWLFPNGCFVPEDFVTDLNPADNVEVYNGQSSGTVWCLCRGSFVWLAFVENDSNGNVYRTPMVHMRHGTRTLTTAPYVRGNSRRAAGFSSARRSHWQLQPSPSSSSSRIQTSYDGPSQNYNSSGRFHEFSANNHGAQAGFRGPQSIRTGTNRGPSHGGSFQHAQTFHGHSAQMMQGNAHRSNASWNGYPQTGQTRLSEVAAVPLVRPFHASSSDWGWMNEQTNEHGPWGAQNSFRQNSNQPLGRDERVWSLENQVEAQTTRMYAPHTQPVTSNHVWALVPPGNDRSHRTLPNLVPSSYHGGHLFGAGLIPRPSTSSYGHIEHVTDGGFTWLSPGSH